jgi:hypothetical protein
MLPTFTSSGGAAAGRLGPSLVYGAQHAPLTSGGSLSGFGGGAAFLGGAHTSRYLRRAFSVAQWDLEATFYQLIYSCRAPARVYKLTQHRKQTKNQWARDDPAFVALLLAFLAVSAVGYGVAYEYPSPLAYGWLVLQAWLHFALSGAALATASWAVANRHMLAPVLLAHSAGEQEVEWLYAWDVHCNAFVPVLLACYVGQYALLPLLLRDGFLPALAANALYACAAAHYVYITFSGYLGAWDGRGMDAGRGGVERDDVRAACIWHHRSPLVSPPRRPSSRRTLQCCPS